MGEGVGALKKGGLNLLTNYASSYMHWMQASNIVRNIFWKDARDSFRGCFLLVSSVTDITADYFTEKIHVLVK